MNLPLLRCAFLLLLLGTTSLRVCAQDGAALYRQRCAVCHEGGAADRAPDRSILQKFPSASIARTLETGVMREVVGSLTPAERDAIATYLTGKAPNPLADEVARPMAGMCAPVATSFIVTSGAPQWNGWSVDVQNHRSQPAAMAGLSAADVPRLKLKWAFGFDGDTLTFSQPTIVGGRVFVGSQQGKVFSLDAATGCIQWSFPAESSVRTSITIAALPGPGEAPVKYASYFGDQRG